MCTNVRLFDTLENMQNSFRVAFSMWGILEDRPEQKRFRNVFPIHIVVCISNSLSSNPKLCYNNINCDTVISSLLLQSQRCTFIYILSQIGQKKICPNVAAPEVLKNDKTYLDIHGGSPQTNKITKLHQKEMHFFPFSSALPFLFCTYFYQGSGRFHTNEEMIRVMLLF